MGTLLRCTELLPVFLLVVTLGSGAGGVDLRAGLTAQPNPSVAGTWVDLEATIRNNGSETAHGVTAEFELAGNRMLNAGQLGGCSAVGSMRMARSGNPQIEPWNVSCPLGVLDPGATVTAPLSSRTDAVEVTDARLEAGSLEIDVRPEDNLARVRLISR